jgi:NADP-dependent 3-hydroxy acid dehydrogenase YdfG
LCFNANFADRQLEEISLRSHCLDRTHNTHIMGSSPSLSRTAILDAIWETVPIDTPEPTESLIRSKLTELTSSLIDISGRRNFNIDPFSEVYQRRVAIDLPQVTASLKDKVVLITGGQGFVGTNLIAKLQEFGVKKIVSIDINSEQSQRVAIATTANRAGVPVSYYHADVRQPQSLQAIFEIERPQIVFHLAAERLPGLAEIQIHQTVSTNIFGCQNIIDLCEANHVEACIFSSTGKASRYFTPDIYAASKKIAEWIFSDYSHPKTCRYGIVRFTHVVENSPVSADLDRCIERGIVSMHAPDRCIYTQNIEETIGLLLNALTILETGQTKILAVKDLGWPIDTLDLALHKIVRSGRDLPLYFKGIPAGYERHVFLGQLDLSGTRETLPMLNVLEADISEISVAGDTVISQIAPFDNRILADCLAKIELAIFASDSQIKQTVIDGEKQVALSSFAMADAARLADIIAWGSDIRELSAAGVDLHYHQDTLALLIAGMSSTKAGVDRQDTLVLSGAGISITKVTATEPICVVIPALSDNREPARIVERDPARTERDSALIPISRS